MQEISAFFRANRLVTPITISHAYVDLLKPERYFDVSIGMFISRMKFARLTMRRIFEAALT
jgi:hypothetical protein